METNDLRKAAEMALEALEDVPLKPTEWSPAVEALRQALAQPDLAKVGEVGVWGEKPWVKSYCGGKPNYCTPEVTPQVTGEVLAQPEQEPVCFLRETSWSYEIAPWDDPNGIPVYIAPPQKEWVRLTADEIWKCNKAETGSAVEFHICSAHQNVIDFAEAIEQALKEKNT